MVVSGNDPVESFLNSLQVVKNVFSPIESNFRKAAKNLERCFPGVSKNGKLIGNTFNVDIELVTAQLNVKEKSGTGGGQCMVVNCGEKSKGGLLIGDPIKFFVGIFSEKCGSNIDNDNKNNSSRCDGVADVNVKKKRLKERYGNANGGEVDKVSCTNCLQFAVSWSSLINGFVQGFPSPFKAGKKRVQKTSNGVGVCSDDSCVKHRVADELRQNESKGKEGKDFSFECFVGFVFDQLSQNLPKFDVSAQESECNSGDTAASTPADSNQFDHLRALASILEGKRADVNGFLGNLMFARVGGMPSNILGVPPSVKEASDEGVGTGVTQEENGGNSPQRLANGLLSIPLSNVERLRTTLSTVSLTELIELLPQLGRPSKEDHPDKKKLFSVQDFFRYTEAEGMLF
ncbi:uncharacterized protein LOC111389423 [Olea europaea var. sylvestris]|uniref:uncharacterized protein LOC111389423 n=1 Tax=Olea europaea var. sylvestris TaxID=158386 RepID=UPI000C1D5F6A|nr:uncharacterized protein LOC111389423 [Olea europaea var. sylvestris]